MGVLKFLKGLLCGSRKPQIDEEAPPQNYQYQRPSIPTPPLQEPKETVPAHRPQQRPPAQHKQQQQIPKPRYYQQPSQPRIPQYQPQTQYQVRTEYPPKPTYQVPPQPDVTRVQPPISRPQAQKPRPQSPPIQQQQQPQKSKHTKQPSQSQIPRLQSPPPQQQQQTQAQPQQPPQQSRHARRPSIPQAQAPQIHQPQPQKPQDRQYPPSRSRTPSTSPPPKITRSPSTSPPPRTTPSPLPFSAVEQQRPRESPPSRETTTSPTPRVKDTPAVIPLKPLQKRFDDNAINQRNEHYKSLRARAHQEGDSMARCFSQSKEAYNSGNGARAKELSVEGKKHQAEMDKLNAEARDWIFRENNLDSAPDEIDLHGLYVKEAIEKTEQALLSAHKRGDPQIRIITGKGLHSPQQAAKLKPAIEQLMVKHRLAAELDPHNAGVLIVSLNAKPNRNSMTADDLTRRLESGQDECVIM